MIADAQILSCLHHSRYDLVMAGGRETVADVGTGGSVFTKNTGGDDAVAGADLLRHTAGSTHADESAGIGVFHYIVHSQFHFGIAAAAANAGDLGALVVTGVG